MRRLLLIGLAAGCLAHAALPEFLPPEIKVLAGISVRGLIDSPLLTGIGDAKTATARLMAGSPLASLDPLKDIDDLIIASTAEGDKAPALLVLRGRFGAVPLPGGARPYHGIPVFEDGRTATGTIALLDAGTLIAGDTALVRAAIDRRGKALALPPALIERARDLESHFDLWGAGEVPQGIRSGTAPSPELEAIDRFEFGASLRRGLELTGQVHVRSSKDAEKLMQSMRLIEMMLKAQPKAGSGPKIDLQSAGDAVKFSLFIPEEDLKKGIEAQKAQFAAAMGSQPPPSEGSVARNQQGDAVTVTLPTKKN